MEVTDIMYDLAERLKSLRDEKKETEQRVKDLTAAIDDVERQLVSIMTDTETQNFTRAGNYVLTHDQDPCLGCGRPKGRTVCSFEVRGLRRSCIRDGQRKQPLRFRQ